MMTRLRHHGNDDVSVLLMLMSTAACVRWRSTHVSKPCNTTPARRTTDDCVSPTGAPGKLRYVTCTVI